MKRVTFILLTYFIVKYSNAQEGNAIQKNHNTTQNQIIVKAKELPYYDSTMYKAGINGYQDTFSVDNVKFRIIHHDSLFDGIVQRLNNAKWEGVLEFRNLGNHNDYYVDEDLNNDGYNDICLQWKWDMETFFYNPKMKTFLKQSLRLPSQWFLLDESKGIYCNYQESKTADAFSELYLIQNFKKKVLAYVELKAKKEDNLVLDDATLYKGKRKIMQLPSKEAVKFDYDNYMEWWEKNYKKIMKSP